MATPIRRADGTVVDIDAIPHVSDTDRLELIRDVVERTWADDADKWEADTHLSMDKIETILNIPANGA